MECRESVQKTGCQVGLVRLVENGLLRTGSASFESFGAGLSNKLLHQ
jgi:hypothetical protein